MSVIPAKAGIHSASLKKMDPRFRGDDNVSVRRYLAD